MKQGSGNRLQARNRIASTSPDLLPVFDSALESLPPGIPDAPAARWALRLALASRQQYINAAGLTRVALDRGELEVFGGVLAECSARDFHCGRVLLNRYGSLRFPLSPLSDGIVTMVETGAAGSDSAVPVHRALDQVLAARDGEVALLLLPLWTAVIRRAPLSFADVLVLLGRLAPGQPLSRLQAWLGRGTDLLESGRVDAGLAHVLLQSRESRALFLLSYAVLDDLRSVLRIYLGGLAGRSMDVRPLDPEIGLHSPWTDGATIHLPANLRVGRRPEDNDRHYTALGAIQAGFVRHGSLQLDVPGLSFLNELRDTFGSVIPDVMDTVRRQWGSRVRGVRERATGEVELLFPAGRVIRALETELERFFLLLPAPSLARALYACFERVRVIALLSQRYPGLGRDIRELLNAGLSALPAPDQSAPEHDLQAELRLLLDALAREACGARALRSARYAPLSALLSGPRRASDPAASAWATFRCIAQLYQRYPVVPFAMTEDCDAILDPLRLGSPQPELAAAVSPGLVTMRPDRRAATTPLPAGQVIDVSRLSEREQRSRSQVREIMGRELGRIRLPEFDLRSGQLRPDRVTVHLASLPAADPAPIDRILRDEQQTARRLLRRFATVRPAEISFQRRLTDGSEMHTGDLLDYLTDFRRGGIPDERVYQHKQVNTRQIATLVLLDTSSSTEEALRPGVGTRRAEISQASVALLAAGLQAAGDSFAVYRYFSLGAPRVIVQPVKAFGEHWNGEARGRLAACEPIGGNRDGAAIRYATRLLAERDERYRLLLLVSDGLPADAGYGSKDPSEPTRYGLADTAHAVTEARQRGIVPFCVTVAVDGRSFLPRIWGNRGFALVDRVEQLPSRLARSYLRLTA